MTTSTTIAIAPLYPEVHPLALSSAEEGRLAYNVGDDLEDNPYSRTHNARAWSEWHDGWVACQRDRDNQDEYDREFYEWCMAEATCW